MQSKLVMASPNSQEFLLGTVRLGGLGRNPKSDTRPLKGIQGKSPTRNLHLGSTCGSYPESVDKAVAAQ